MVSKKGLALGLGLFTTAIVYGLTRKAKADEPPAPPEEIPPGLSYSESPRLGMDDVRFYEPDGQWSVIVSHGYCEIEVVNNTGRSIICHADGIISLKLPGSKVWGDWKNTTIYRVKPPIIDPGDYSLIDRGLVVNELTIPNGLTGKFRCYYWLGFNEMDFRVRFVGTAGYSPIKGGTWEGFA